MVARRRLAAQLDQLARIGQVTKISAFADRSKYARARDLLFGLVALRLDYDSRKAHHLAAFADLGQDVGPECLDVIDARRTFALAELLQELRAFLVLGRNLARLGPRAIRAVERIGPYNHASRIAPVASLAFADVGDCPVSRYSLDDSLADIEAYFNGVMDAGVRTSTSRCSTRGFDFTRIGSSTTLRGTPAASPRQARRKPAGAPDGARQ